MPDSDPRDGFFYLPLTPMKDPYRTNDTKEEKTEHAREYTRSNRPQKSEVANLSTPTRYSQC